MNEQENVSEVVVGCQDLRILIRRGTSEEILDQMPETPVGWKRLGARFESDTGGGQILAVLVDQVVFRNLD
jgi:hypothetical protein